MRKGILLLTALLAFPLAASAQVGPTPSPQIATQSPSDIAREGANQGDADAELRLGYFYEVGFADIPQDCDEAIKWYRKSMDQGNSEALDTLARLYDDGAGILRECQDHAEAVKLYRKLSDQGNGTRQSRLAVFYETGDGIPQDRVEALKWFQKVLDRKEYGIYSILTDMYYLGRGSIRTLCWRLSGLLFQRRHPRALGLTSTEDRHS